MNCAEAINTVFAVESKNVGGLCESCRFMNSMRSLPFSKAFTLLHSDKPLQSQNSRTDVTYNSSVLCVTSFTSKALRRLVSAGMHSTILICCRTRTRPLVADTAVSVRFVTRPFRNPLAKRVEVALRNQLLVVLCREEVGSSQTFRPCRCPTRQDYGKEVSVASPSDAVSVSEHV